MCIFLPENIRLPRTNCNFTAVIIAFLIVAQNMSRNYSENEQDQKWYQKKSLHSKSKEHFKGSLHYIFDIAN